MPLLPPPEPELGLVGPASADAVLQMPRNSERNESGEKSSRSGAAGARRRRRRRHTTAERETSTGGSNEDTRMHAGLD